MGYYKDHTVEITFKGKKYRVHKNMEDIFKPKKVKKQPKKEE